MRNSSPSALIYIPLDVWVTVTALSPSLMTTRLALGGE